MRIMITGDDEVSSHLAKLLYEEAQDIYIIDTNSELLGQAKSKMGVFTVEGDSTSIKTLREATS